MWTGDMVVATIDKSTLDFVNPLLKRKAYIWWNFPVSDYVQDHLLLGPVYGNGLDIKMICLLCFQSDGTCRGFQNLSVQCS